LSSKNTFYNSIKTTIEARNKIAKINDNDNWIKKNYEPNKLNNKKTELNNINKRMTELLSKRSDCYGNLNSKKEELSRLNNTTRNDETINKAYYEK